MFCYKQTGRCNELASAEFKNTNSLATQENIVVRKPISIIYANEI